MRPTVTLTKDSTTVTLPGPARFGRTSLGCGQARGRTAGGETYVYELGPEVYEAEIEFHSLTGAEKEGLASFFKDTALGMQESFTYTDSAGREFAARFIEPVLVFVQFARNVWDVSVRAELTTLLD